MNWNKYTWYFIIHIYIYRRYSNNNNYCIALRNCHRTNVRFSYKSLYLFLSNRNNFWIECNRFREEREAHREKEKMFHKPFTLMFRINVPLFTFIHMHVYIYLSSNQQLNFKRYQTLFHTICLTFLIIKHRHPLSDNNFRFNTCITKKHLSNISVDFSSIYFCLLLQIHKRCCIMDGIVFGGVWYRDLEQNYHFKKKTQAKWEHIPEVVN